MFDKDLSKEMEEMGPPRMGPACMPDALALRGCTRGFKDWLYHDLNASLDDALAPGFFAAVSDSFRHHDSLYLVLSNGLFHVYVCKGPTRQDCAIEMVNQAAPERYTWEGQDEAPERTNTSFDDADVRFDDVPTEPSPLTTPERLLRDVSYFNSRLWFTFEDSVMVGLPIDRFPDLEENLDKLSRYETVGHGHGCWWPEIGLTVMIPRVDLFD